MTGRFLIRQNPRLFPAKILCYDRKKPGDKGFDKLVSGRFVMSNNKKNNGSYGLPLGMCIGLAIGTAVGAATHNIGSWMPIGLSVGLCLGLVLGHNSDDDNGDHDEDL